LNSLILPRRAFLKELIGLVAAPAVVKAESLMPIKPFPTFLYKPLRPIGPDYPSNGVSVSLGDVRFRVQDVYPIYKHYGWQFGAGMPAFPRPRQRAAAAGRRLIGHSEARRPRTAAGTDRSPSGGDRG
jgi:hypothetical protein